MVAWIYLEFVLRVRIVMVVDVVTEFIVCLLIVSIKQAWTLLGQLCLILWQELLGLTIEVPITVYLAFDWIMAEGCVL